MSHITLITGSTLGGAEYVADHLSDLLEQAGHSTDIINQAELEQLSTDNIWLVVCSTHGAGEFPDNFQPFVEQLTNQHPDLARLRYGVIGLGDSSYDTFCAAARNIDQQLAKLGGDPPRRTIGNRCLAGSGTGRSGRIMAGKLEKRPGLSKKQTGFYSIKGDQ